MRLTNTHLFFYDNEFSKDYLTSFKDFNGNEFSSLSQFIVYHTAKIFMDNIMAKKILRENDIEKLKIMSTEIKGFDEKVLGYSIENILLLGNYYKISQNENMKNILDKHSSYKFVEADPYDTKFGIGIHWTDNKVVNEDEWLGDNLGGKAIDSAKNSILGEVPEWIVDNAEWVLYRDDTEYKCIGCGKEFIIPYKKSSPGSNFTDRDYKYVCPYCESKKFYGKA